MKLKKKNQSNIIIHKNRVCLMTNEVSKNLRRICDTSLLKEKLYVIYSNKYILISSLLFIKINDDGTIMMRDKSSIKEFTLSTVFIFEIY